MRLVAARALVVALISSIAFGQPVPQQTALQPMAQSRATGARPPVPVGPSGKTSLEFLAETTAQLVPELGVKGSPSYAGKLPKRTHRCVITSFGAVADNATVNTKAIQAAIDSCAEQKKGGVVVVPQGTFRSGSIFLKQGVNLLVEKGGVLKGTSNPDDYPQIKTRWEGTEETYTASFINAEGVTGLEISGEGMIDGAGDEWVAKSPYRRAAVPPGGAPAGYGYSAAAPQLMTVTPAQLANSPAPTQRRGRPRLIGIQNSRSVRVAGLSLHNQAVWCLFVLYSENVEIDGIRIAADHNIPSSDGMDIDSSKHVHINHSFLDDNDDCISIKSGKDADGLRVNRPAEDILVENSHFAYGQGGVAMGSETSGGIRNVTVLNCLFDDGNWAPIRFKSQPSRGGVVENITYKDLVLHNTKQAFEMNGEWRMVGPRAPDSKPLPVIRNVKIVNVSGDVQSVGAIHGLAGAPIQGITFTNCKITAVRGFRLDHARDVDLKGLTISVQQGDAVTMTDVQ